MIVNTLQQTVAEINGIWNWITGIIAGWGLTFTLVVAAIIYAHIRINRMRREVVNLRNQHVTETRDLSLRLRNLEK
jgi:hypothetical protein